MSRTLKTWRVLPKLALRGLIKNGEVYYPYFCAGIFSVFTFFVFSSILHNEIINILPRSMYAWMLLQIGRVLLGIILLPFLFYTNSFLIKRRKKEIGLYSILGLEKKHIGSMLAAEAVLSYIIVVAVGILCGTVLSKLLFLLLLRMTGLPIDVTFVFYPAAFAETAVFFLAVYAVNLISNLIQVGKSRPTELLSGGKRGEKEPKFLWFYTLLGLVILGWGYWISITSVIDSMIFTNFFLAIFLVVTGTYFLFTSGSVAFLKLLKKNKKVYYQPTNFITISGMLYRMKKNAASLSNICIFSTMVIITLTCTSSLYLGLNGIMKFDFPFDVDAYFTEKEVRNDSIVNKMGELEKKYGLEESNSLTYKRIMLSCGKDEYSFGTAFEDYTRTRDNYKVNILLLEDYNQMEHRAVELGEEEVLVFSSGADFAYDRLVFMGKEFTVKEEPESLRIAPKSEKNVFQGQYFVVVKDKKVHDELVGAWAKESKVADIPGFCNSDYRVFRFCIEGEEADREAFVQEFEYWCKLQPGYVDYNNNLEGRDRNKSMNGGLLFIGVLFSLIFLMCLLLIMYYKQIAEGYEDKDGFAIMQQVGMSSREIKATIRKQSLLVFFLPLAGAVLHTAAGMFMVNQLFAAIVFFDTKLIVSCAVGVVLLFIIFYVVSYWFTSKTYYGIVSRGQH